MLERPSQSPGLNLCENLLQNSTYLVPRRSQFDLTELFCKEESSNDFVSPSAKLVKPNACGCYLRRQGVWAAETIALRL